MLGAYYLNTSYVDYDYPYLEMVDRGAGGGGGGGVPLAGDQEAVQEAWQWSSTIPTRMSNGSVINVTRNYTYFVAAEKGPVSETPP